MKSLKIVEYDADLVELAQNFDCGNEYLNSFLKEGDALNPNIGKTFVWISLDNQIIGYYNITGGSLEVQYKNTFTKIGGSIHINDLALNKPYQGLTHRALLTNDMVKFSDILLQQCLR